LEESSEDNRNRIVGWQDIRDWIVGSFQMFVVTNVPLHGFAKISPHPGFKMLTHLFRCTKKLDRFLEQNQLLKRSSFFVIVVNKDIGEIGTRISRRSELIFPKLGLK
jgi:hypothetical protein